MSDISKYIKYLNQSSAEIKAREGKLPGSRPSTETKVVGRSGKAKGGLPSGGQPKL